ncbi:MAG: Gfo/Idh/MocA family oxidoreductase [Rhodospirillales bacterium]
MTKAPLRIAVVGVGKIVRDQHLPVLAESADFLLVAAASRNATVEGVPTFKSVEALLREGPTLDALALCMPPQARFDAALTALRAGKHVLLEKPPGASLGEVEILRQAAAETGTTLFASWHSRHASAVERARQVLATRAIRSVAIDWKEDVRRWHPGQEWIWQPGGLGVFDPGINALSILTAILPRPLFATAARLTFPANRQAPIAAELTLADAEGLTAQASFDWRQTGEQTWRIALDTDEGPVVLEAGGSRLDIDGLAGEALPDREYAGLYSRFAELIRAARSDLDPAPLRLVADAFLLGERSETDAFFF